MNRINRVTSILIQLQSKKIIPAKEIAQRFNISLRTVYRDIRTLEEAGIPIGSEAGKGYFLVEGFLLPPVMFTAAEVGALICFVVCSAIDLNPSHLHTAVYMAFIMGSKGGATHEQRTRSIWLYPQPKAT